MAQVYRHIRLDKNEPFYIGITDNNKYRKSEKKGRNVIWKNIVNKTNYTIEILLDNLSYKEAIEKEIEFIKLYGRIDIKTGILANMTNGGEGTVGRKYTPSVSHKCNLSKASLGKKMSDESRKKMSINQKLQILQFDLNGNFIKEFDGIIDAAKEMNGYSTNIVRCCSGKFKKAYGFIWRYKNPGKFGRKNNNKLKNK